MQPAHAPESTLESKLHSLKQANGVPYLMDHGLLLLTRRFSACLPQAATGK